MNSGVFLLGMALTYNVLSIAYIISMYFNFFTEKLYKILDKIFGISKRNSTSFSFENCFHYCSQNKEKHSRHKNFLFFLFHCTMATLKLFGAFIVKLISYYSTNYTKSSWCSTPLNMKNVRCFISEHSLLSFSTFVDCNLE